MHKRGTRRSEHLLLQTNPLAIPSRATTDSRGVPQGDLALYVGDSAMTEGLKNANIGGGVGGLKLTLPRDVGVRVDVEKCLSGVDASGFSREGDAYVNDAYGESDLTLFIDLKVGLGGVELNLSD